MKKTDIDILIIGGGPVGLLSAYLSALCGLSVCLVDKSSGPITVGRADALNARSLQLLEIIGLFDELYPLGKTCNTSSVWSNGDFISRQSTWWENLEGCQHKHFLMLGQSHIEKLLDRKLQEQGVTLHYQTSAENIELTEQGCRTTLSNGASIHSRFVIGADGSRSFVRNHFAIGFEIERPQITWAVIDGVIESSFPKVPEIIVFQADTSDVAWIPREGNIDRFYVRMDKKNFSQEEAIAKIKRAMAPHSFAFKQTEWFSQFSVKESIAESYSAANKVFLAGDSCHIHSVNGGQGLNTGLADAFNLIWKLNQVIHHHAEPSLLHSYEDERKPVAKGVVDTSGALVRSTKYSEQGTHAIDYVKLVEARAGYITGMGIGYGSDELVGQRLFDLALYKGKQQTRLYSLINYQQLSVVIFSGKPLSFTPPKPSQLIQVFSEPTDSHYSSNESPYKNQALLVRPDGYIANTCEVNQQAIVEMIEEFFQ